MTFSIMTVKWEFGTTVRRGVKWQFWKKFFYILKLIKYLSAKVLLIFQRRVMQFSCTSYVNIFPMPIHIHKKEHSCKNCMSGQNFNYEKKTMVGTFESRETLITYYNTMFNFESRLFYCMIFYMIISTFFFKLDFLS